MDDVYGIPDYRNSPGTGFLSKNEDNGKYRLGNMVYYLGAIARGNSDMRSCALPVMQKINQITNETVHIFVRDGISRVCIEQVTSHQTIRMSCEIGVRDVLWIGNTGRVLMAFCEKQKREELFAGFTKQLRKLI